MPHLLLLLLLLFVISITLSNNEIRSLAPRHLGSESIGNTRHRRRQRKFLQGAEADFYCDTMVQICGAVPPHPQGGNRHFVTVPRPLGGEPA